MATYSIEPPVEGSTTAPAKYEKKEKTVTWIDRVDLFNLGLLFVFTVTIALILVGVATSGTSPWLIVFPTVMGFFSILSLRR